MYEEPLPGDASRKTQRETPPVSPNDITTASCTARCPTCRLGILDFIALYHDTTGSNRPTLRLGWAKHVPKMRPEHANTYDTTHW